MVCHAAMKPPDLDGEDAANILRRKKKAAARLAAAQAEDQGRATLASLPRPLTVGRRHRRPDPSDPSLQARVLRRGNSWTLSEFEPVVIEQLCEALDDCGLPVGEPVHLATVRRMGRHIAAVMRGALVESQILDVMAEVLRQRRRRRVASHLTLALQIAEKMATEGRWTPMCAQPRNSRCS